MKDQILKAVYQSGLHQTAPGVLRTIWKDGVEIDEPSLALLNFVNKLCAIKETANAVEP